MSRLYRATRMIRSPLRRWNCGVACSFGKDSVVMLDSGRRQDRGLPHDDGYGSLGCLPCPRPSTGEEREGTR